MPPYESAGPLLGDGHGHYKIAIVGNSGTGKSTLCRDLTEALKIPALSLDHVHWNPGWVETPKPEFRDQVQQFMDSPQRDG
ncbi:AAA domain protein [Rhizoctonia solani]|uniref:AAA domain protein n=1 Tax=Rhizoctonia solani TaxID=456999 RepID=A0A8H8T1H3_9AGAM|nr:AAA domain protein [Rhizoctonia solani]QRW25359.1 AAA domain protein [Rhizoctonia solani]